MVKQIAIITAVIVFFLGFSGCQSSSGEIIKLDNIPSIFTIKAYTRTLKVSRGAYTYTLKKKAVLNNKRYVVVDTDSLSFTSEHQPAPEDAFVRTINIVPANDKRALRAIRELSVDIPEFNARDKKAWARVNQTSRDFQYLNDTKFGIGILPAAEGVKTTVTKIKAGDTIALSGVLYRHAVVMRNGKKEPLSFCLSHVRAAFVKSLEIK
ncbi:MAG: hypothetical protein WDL87_09355 [Candidatus Omnitrophota bacterium]|jgi:hypothetical protein